MDLMTKSKKEPRHNNTSASAVQYCLLDRDLRIINSSLPTENSENGVTGASFFDVFPAKRSVREEIVDYARSYPQECLLTLCGRVPVLFVGSLAAHTGLIPVLLPQGAVKSTLAFPAAFHGVPAHVCVSGSAQMRYKAHDEAAFAEACRWLVSVSAPFVCSAEAERSLASVLSFAAARLSALLELPFSCDFAGIGAVGCTKVDVAFGVGVMLAALAAAKREKADNGVRLYAASEGAPTLYLEYTRCENADTVSEFSPLLACAAARGAVLDVVSPIADPSLVQIRACLGVVELSAQGVRERHRFLEGKSPLSILPQAAACALPFPEFLFD